MRKKRKTDITGFLFYLMGRSVFFCILIGPENVPEHQDCTDAENEFRCTLRVSQSVERENHIQDKKCRNFQDQLPHDRKQKSISSESQCLEDTHCQEVYADKADAKSESMEEPGSVCDDRFIVHKQADEPSGIDIIKNRHYCKDRDDQLQGKENGIFHPSPVAGSKVIAYKRHDSLGESHCHLHRNHVDLVGDSHGGHGVRPVGGSKIVQDRHPGHVEQVLDGSRDADTADLPDDLALDPEFLWIDADKCISPFYIKKNEKIQAGHTVGNTGGKSGACRTH